MFQQQANVTESVNVAEPAKGACRGGDIDPWVFGRRRHGSTNYAHPGEVSNSTYAGENGVSARHPKQAQLFASQIEARVIVASQVA